RTPGSPPGVPRPGGCGPPGPGLAPASRLLFGAAPALPPAFLPRAPPAGPQAVASAPGAAGPAAAPGAEAGVPRPSAATPPAVGPQAGRPGPGGQEQALGPAHHRIRRTEKIYVVQPPEGGYHESWWEIAKTHLGDGRRYREIFELNKDRVQPDGSKLTIASLIRPGWILHMPRDAHGPGIRVMTLHEHAAAPGGDVRP